MLSKLQGTQAAMIVMAKALYRPMHKEDFKDCIDPTLPGGAAAQNGGVYEHYVRKKRWDQLKQVWIFETWLYIGSASARYQGFLVDSKQGYDTRCAGDYRELQSIGESSRYRAAHFAINMLRFNSDRQFRQIDHFATAALEFQFERGCSRRADISTTYVSPFPSNLWSCRRARPPARRKMRFKNVLMALPPLMFLDLGSSMLLDDSASPMTDPEAIAMVDSVGNPGQVDQYIVVISDGWDIKSHLAWLSAVLVDNGGSAIPGYPPAAPPDPMDTSTDPPVGTPNFGKPGTPGYIPASPDYRPAGGLFPGQGTPPVGDPTSPAFIPPSDDYIAPGKLFPGTGIGPIGLPGDADYVPPSADWMPAGVMYPGHGTPGIGSPTSPNHVPPSLDFRPPGDLFPGAGTPPIGLPGEDGYVPPSSNWMPAGPLCPVSNLPATGPGSPGYQSGYGPFDDGKGDDGSGDYLPGAGGGGGGGNGGAGGSDGDAGGGGAPGDGAGDGPGSGTNPLGVDEDDPNAASGPYMGPPGPMVPDPMGTGDGAACSMLAIFPDAGMYTATLVGSVLASVLGKAGVESVSTNDDFFVAAPTFWRQSKRQQQIPAGAPLGFNVTLKQADAPWHLPVASNRKLQPPKAGYYSYNATAGRGVDIYIVDTGVNVNHRDFKGRARWGFVSPQYSRMDGLGHGTHVAGLAGGATWSIAKEASIVAVKVIGDGGSGSAGDIINGIKWSIDATKQSKRRSVINLSLAGPPNAGLDRMVLHALKSGIPVVVAAGNSGDSAAGYSPGRVKAALTIGAIDPNYQYWTRSCNGHSVDLLAPGVDVTSTWITSNLATTTLSGSSMAAPQVAGLVAYHLSLYPKLRVRSVNRRLKRRATPNLVKGAPLDSTNKVLFNCWNENCYPLPPPKNVTLNITVPTNVTAPANDTSTVVPTSTLSTLAPAEPTPAAPPGA